MKTILLSKRSALLTPRRLATLLASGAFILIVLGLRIFFPSAFFVLLTPLSAAGAYLTALVQGVEAQWADAAERARTIDRLQFENSALVEQNLVLSAKVSDLTRLLGASPREEPGVIAGVIARPPQAPYDVLLVDTGSGTVVPGMLALTAGNTPVGTVESVTGRGARIVLFSAPGQSLSGWIGEGREAITLLGRGAGSWSALVQKDVPLAIGDLVYLAGRGAIPVGRVRAVESSLSSPTVTVHIAPLTNLFSTTWVQLVP